MNKIKVRYNQASVDQMAALMEQLQLNTVCSAANCPNLGECYQRKTATFMIMGNNCTRNCRFCNVSSGETSPLNPKEPEAVAQAVKRLGLKHVVITSVTRDDLADGGASHFAQTIKEVRKVSPSTTVEVLIPDLNGRQTSLDRIIFEKPEVINHNLETVPSLYDIVRPEAEYARSLNVLRYIKEQAPEIVTKTGIMVGLGEGENEVYQVMDEVRAAACDIFTIGQYLQPTIDHIHVKEFISQEMFDRYHKEGIERGFRYVASGPLVRSSYHAEEALI